MSESASQSHSNYILQFYSKEFWDNFYKNRNQKMNNINWYFDLTKVKLNEFSLKDISKEKDILLIGAGLCSTLDYFNNNNYDKITIFDFSEELKSILVERYNKDWDIESYDITEVSSNFANGFDIIIDKGCLDCILSEPINGENKFLAALTNIIGSLDEKGGIFYYFSSGKIEDRINLFYKVPKIKFKFEIVDINNKMKDEYQEFNQSDNIYFI